MRLKKTTVLTGNHTAKQQRDRASSDAEALHGIFKNDLASHVGLHLSGESPNKNVNEKKYVVKTGKGQLEVQHEEYVAYRKKSHAV